MSTSNMKAGHSTKLKAAVAARFSEYVRDLETITNIDSVNGDPEGSAQVADFLQKKLTVLGATVELRKNDRATHVVARITGKGKFRLLLMAHIDTAFNKGAATERPFRLDEQTLLAYGAGVGDDKATVIQTLQAMSVLQEIGFDDFAEIILYFNGEEEGGSPTAEAIVAELAQQVDLTICMDTARPNWGIVTRRKGTADYRIEVYGTAGHAGNAAHVSASATMELGHQITMLYALASPLPEDPSSLTYEALAKKGIADYGQYTPENAINVAVVGTTNTKHNVIPDNAFAIVNVRCFKMAEHERLDREIKALSAKTIVPGTRVEISGGIGIEPMDKTPQVQKLIDLYKNIVKQEYNAEVVEWMGGGVTDGNRSAHFVPTIDALGIENYEEHTYQEYVDLKTVEPRTVALVIFIMELAGQSLTGDEA